MYLLSELLSSPFSPLVFFYLLMKFIIFIFYRLLLNPYAPLGDIWFPKLLILFTIEFPAPALILLISFYLSTIYSLIPIDDETFSPAVKPL